MAVIELHQPKLAETLIDDSVTLREAEVERCCEILAHSHMEYATLGSPIPRRISQSLTGFSD